MVRVPNFVRAKLCTDVLSRDIIKEVAFKQPCMQKYTARCGWLSLNYCTFYHQTYCDKKRNDTVVTYYVKTDCCKGFYRAQNGSCLSFGSGKDHRHTTTKAPGYIIISNGGNHTHKVSVSTVKHEDFGEKISAGGYAGIICGFVLLCAVAFFIMRAVRKRQKRKPRKPLPINVTYRPASNPPSPEIIQPASPEQEPLAGAAASDNNDNSKNDNELLTEIPESVV